MHWVNGERAAQVSIHDRGLLYGDGLFETMLWDSHRIQLLRFHLERLQHGCALLQIKYSEQALQEQLQQVLDTVVAEGLSAAVIRLTVTRGQGPRGYAAHSGNKPTIIISVSSTAPPEPAQSARLHLCENRLAIGSPMAGLKHLNRLEQVLMANEVELAGCEEGLVLDYEGTVVSGSRSNIFIVSDSGLCTPALDRCGIAGTVRRLVIDRLAGDLNMEVNISRMSLADVEKAKEVFCCNSIIGIMPVTFFRDRIYREFPISRAISQAYVQAITEAD